MWWEFLQEKSLQLCKRAIFLAIFWLQEMVHNQQHMKLEAWDIRIFFGGGVDKMVGSCESQWYWRERHTLDVSMCISVSTLQLWIYIIYIYVYTHTCIIYYYIHLHLKKMKSLFARDMARVPCSFWSFLQWHRWFRTKCKVCSSLSRRSAVFCCPVIPVIIAKDPGDPIMGILWISDPQEATQQKNKGALRRVYAVRHNLFFFHKKSDHQAVVSSGVRRADFLKWPWKIC